MNELTIRDMKKKVIMLIVMVAAVVLPAMAQQFGEKETRVGGMYDQKTTFQSTSTLQGIGSAYSSTPMISAQGTAEYSGASTPSGSGPRRAKMDDDDWPTSQDPEEGDPDSPIGDAALPLSLFALAYAIYMMVSRRRKA